MITWIQTTFQKHHKLALGTLLGITIVSFVFFGSWSGAGGSRQTETYLGVDTKARREIGPFYDLAAVMGSRGDLNSLIFYKHIADVAQIPEPTDAQLREFYKKELGGGDIKIAAALRANIAVRLQQHSQATPGSPADNDARVDAAFRQLIRIHSAFKLLAAPEFSDPFEGQLRWQATNTSWTIETATLAGAGFDPKIDASDDKVKPYFEAHKKDFTIKQQTLAAAAVFTAKPDDNKPAKNETPASDEDLRTFALNNEAVVKATFKTYDSLKLTEQLKSNRADFLKAYNASKAPLDRLGGRITEWLEKKLPGGEPTNYESAKRTLIAEGAVFVEPAAFSEDNVPSNAKVGDITIPTALLKNALRLNRDEWRSGQYDLPLQPGKPAAVVVFLWRKTIPAREPTFAEVKDKVVKKFTAQEKSRLRDERDTAEWRKLDEQLRAGKSFADAAKAQKLTYKTFPAFKFPSAGKDGQYEMNNFPVELLYAYQRLSSELRRSAAGTLLPKMRTGNDALFVRLIKREAPELKAEADKKAAEDLAKAAAANAAQSSLHNTLAGLQAAIAPVQKRKNDDAAGDHSDADGHDHSAN
jgi:peptidyl-prolyl cis-trans isomerase D